MRKLKSKVYKFLFLQFGSGDEMKGLSLFDTVHFFNNGVIIVEKGFKNKIE